MVTYINTDIDYIYIYLMNTYTYNNTYNGSTDRPSFTVEI